MEKISVIVPIYNAENYIKRCCGSILQQTYTNLEVLLIDDGSVDNSPRICDQIAEGDARVKVIHTINQGVSEARNTGIKNASGDWVMFIDADDWIDKNVAEKLVQRITNSKADLGVYSFAFEYQSNKVFCEVDKLDCSIKELLQTANSLKESNSVFCSVCNKIYKRNVLDENDISFYKGIKFGEDFIFNTRYFACIEKIVTENTAFYHYDCSVDNSGVKKLYANYDYFILKMEESLKELLSQCEIDEELAKEFCLRFIMERWDYAFSICVENNISYKEKVECLTEWTKHITQEIWKESLGRKNLVSKFAKYLLYKESFLKIGIMNELLLIALNRRILFVKQTIRRVLIK